MLGRLGLLFALVLAGCAHSHGKGHGKGHGGHHCGCEGKEGKEVKDGESCSAEGEGKSCGCGECKQGECKSCGNAPTAGNVVAPGEAKVGDTTTCAGSGETFVVTAESPKAEYNGKTYYFCCEDCQAAFLKDPAKYVPAAK